MSRFVASEDVILGAGDLASAPAGVVEMRPNGEGGAQVFGPHLLGTILLVEGGYEVADALGAELGTFESPDDAVGALRTPPVASAYSDQWLPLTVIGEGVVGWIMDTDDGIMLADTEANYIGTYATHAEVRAALEA